MVLIREEEIVEEMSEAECNIDYEKLKKRMWKDRVLLQKLKEKRQKQEPDVEAKQEASKRKKMSRAQDSVLKYMVKIMEVCNAQGFVYGIIPEKGKPMSSASGGRTKSALTKTPPSQSQSTSHSSQKTLTLTLLPTYTSSKTCKTQP